MTVAAADLVFLEGDVREVLLELPDESVDSVITSPPYWGLRDYGTGTWEGGDPECGHSYAAGGTESGGLANYPNGLTAETIAKKVEGYGHATYLDVCRRCGAKRVDRQVGVERDPFSYIDALVAIFAEVRRVLKPAGTVWLNLGDSYASKARGSDKGWDKSRLTNPGTVQKAQAASLRRDGQRHRGKSVGFKEKDLMLIPARVAIALQEDGWYVRSEIIWAKTNPMPESVSDRPTKSHEQVYLLTKSRRYYFDQDAVREPLSEATTSDARYRRAAAGETPYGEANGKAQGLGRGPRVKFVRGRRDGNEETMYKHPPSPLGRNVRSVWTIPTQPYKGAHFAVMPRELVRRCILAGCPPEGTVLDPFLGAGTTALEAVKLGRGCIGIELNPDFLALAHERCAGVQREITEAA